MGLRYVWEMSHNEVNISNVGGPFDHMAYDTDASGYMCLFKLSEMYAIGSTVYAPLYQKYSCSENNGKTFDVPAGCMVIGLVSSTGYITNLQQLLSTYPYRYSNSAGTISVSSNRNSYYNASGMYAAHFTGGDSISDGKISSENSSQYPSNAFAGKTKYVLQGSDNVDPAALSYTDPVKAGSTIHLTITPSSENVYGGTITYTIQTTTNGEDYYDAGTTTGTSFDVVVPTDAVIWNVRVYAKDDMGFISSTYVYGNNITPWVTVIQSEIVPASGDLGYLTSKNIVAIGVSHLTETTYSLSANLNGSPCFSASDVPIADATFITLEDETWNGIPEDTEQTLDVTITFPSSTDSRTYTFKKFTYDDTSLEGVMEGTARAIRIKREYQTQILGKNLPKEIIKLDNPINSSGLKKATASEAQVFAGYTFFAGDSELRTGVALSTPTTADVSEVIKGKTFYNDKGEFQTGTGAKALQYAKGSVYVGWSGGSGTINIGFTPKWFAYSQGSQIAIGENNAYCKSTGSFDGRTPVTSISQTKFNWTGGNAPTAVSISFDGSNARYSVDSSILTGSLYWWALG